MVNWKSIVSNFFENSDPENDFRHIANDGITIKEIKDFETQFGPTIPKELGDFYLVYNGIGMSTHDESASPRLIRPIQELSEFINETRSVFMGTHPQHASRFFPFFDFENGDIIGYMLDKKGKLLPYLVMFSHEAYSENKSQEAEEFLVPGPPTLADLLSP